MSLIEEARENIRANKPKCGVALLIEEHPGLDEELEAAFAAPDLPGTAIARALQKRYDQDWPKDQTVNRHKSGECSCES